MGKLKGLPEHVTVETGGKQCGTRGFFIEPTVLSGVHQDDAIVQEETFGPVLTLQPFTTEQEAINLANDVDYALASSVWTSNMVRQCVCLGTWISEPYGLTRTCC